MNEVRERLTGIVINDVEGLIKAQESYGDSWKKRGGIGAYMMMARKWDRLENALTLPIKHTGDEPEFKSIFTAIEQDDRAEGIIDDIRDLRRYLLLVEGEAMRRALKSATTVHRDNVVAFEKPQAAGGFVSSADNPVFATLHNHEHIIPKASAEILRRVPRPMQNKVLMPRQAEPFGYQPDEELPQKTPVNETYSVQHMNGFGARSELRRYISEDDFIHMSMLDRQCYLQQHDAPGWELLNKYCVEANRVKAA